MQLARLTHPSSNRTRGFPSSGSPKDFVSTRRWQPSGGRYKYTKPIRLKCS